MEKSNRRGGAGGGAYGSRDARPAAGAGVRELERRVLPHRMPSSAVAASRVGTVNVRLNTTS
jgi:hypothetical protein